jgi:hypothetical protein
MALYAARLMGDEDARVAWEDRMGELHRAFGWPVRRVQTAGLLQDRWTVPSATDWVWARTQITQWQHLVRDRGWAPRRTANHLVAAVLADVLTAAPQDRPQGPRLAPAPSSRPRVITRPYGSGA